MSASAKLTKKQKKGIAFRERKTGKGQTKDGPIYSEDNDVPTMEDQDAITYESLSVEVEKTGEGRWPKPAAPIPVVSNQVEVKRKVGESDRAKKRKRETDAGTTGEGSSEGKSAAKRKKPMEHSAEDRDLGEKKVAPLAKSDKQRFILFVGNLKYTTSLEAIEKHFSACDPPPKIRLLTPKSPGKQTLKSKGCAFLEFTHRNALQQALKLHQTGLDGRMINVELTAGGGGKSENRLEKVRQRNKQLLDQRQERVEKNAIVDGSKYPAVFDRPQRYSATSGVKQTPVTRRTWTVGDADDGAAHRGGKKHGNALKSRSTGKTWGTGVNAIPVG